MAPERVCVSCLFSVRWDVVVSLSLASRDRDQPRGSRAGGSIQEPTGEAAQAGGSIVEVAASLACCGRGRERGGSHLDGGVKRSRD